MTKAVFVYIGEPPAYLSTAMNQAQKYGYDPVLVDSASGSKIDEFNRLATKFDSIAQFRNRFWINTILRFFYLEEYLQRISEPVLYIESDVLIYGQVIPDDPSKLGLIRDAPGRVIPSLLWIPNTESLSHLTNFILTVFEKSPQFYNDMVLLGTYVDLYPDRVTLFNSSLDPSRDVIYDGAAIGQYIGGVDPRNTPGDTRGFINETTTVINMNSVNVARDETGFWLESNGYLWKVMNLHIHSKKLEEYV